jgi:surface antigen
LYPPPTTEGAEMATIEITQEKLQKAAEMRDEGATWNEIRAFTNTKLGSAQFLKRWDAAGIKYRPSGEPKPNTAKKATPATANKKAQPKANGKAPATPKAKKVTIKKQPPKEHHDPELHPNGHATGYVATRTAKPNGKFLHKIYLNGAEVTERTSEHAYNYGKKTADGSWSFSARQLKGGVKIEEVK